MPNTEAPQIDEWVNLLANKVIKIDKNSYFIGHSIGCQTILRYLERQEITQIGGILLVAPWLNLLPAAINDEESYKIAQPWLNIPINFSKVKKFTNNIYCVFSDNDYFVPIKDEKEFKEKLNAHTLILHNLGHISADDNIYEIQDILDIAKKMLNEDKTNS